MFELTRGALIGVMSGFIGALLVMALLVLYWSVVDRRAGRRRRTEAHDRAARRGRPGAGPTPAPRHSSDHEARHR